MNPSVLTQTVKNHFFEIFDEKIGLVNQILECPDVISTPLYNFYASARSKGEVLYEGSGGSTDRDTALSKTIGECLERYCLTNYDCKSFIQTHCHATRNQYPCLLPEQVKIYTSDELKNLSFHLYHDHLETFFCVGYNVTKKNYQYIPLPMVYLRSCFFDHYPQQLNIIQQTISSGAAFGVDFYQTALTGIYEVIERDAMMACWILGQEVLKIQSESLQIKQQKFIQSIEKNDIEVSLYDISLDVGCFVILSCLRSENPRMPAIVFSAGAYHDLDTAIQKSLEEVVLTFGLAESLLRQDRDGYHKFLNPDHWTTEVGVRNEHVRFWSHHEVFKAYAPYIDFILDSSRCISREELIKKDKFFSNSSLAFASIVSFLETQGYDVLLVDISAPEMQSLEAIVLKAIIPGYLPLYLGHRFIYSKPRRLIQIAQKVYGLNEESLLLNLLPHPFP